MQELIIYHQCDSDMNRHKPASGLNELYIEGIVDIHQMDMDLFQASVPLL